MLQECKQHRCIPNIQNILFVLILTDIWIGQSASLLSHAGIKRRLRMKVQQSRGGAQQQLPSAQG